MNSLISRIGVLGTICMATDTWHFQMSLIDTFMWLLFPTMVIAGDPVVNFVNVLFESKLR